ncbi:MAG: DNA internalization-related competence protein ComEC/Rec2, partial [Thermodesulfobacteriota bacterium]
ALVVLLLHPGSLWDASFQFSFSAVFAIFYLVKRFDKLFSKDLNGGITKERNRALDWLTYRIRSLIFITVASSIATLPLSIYHFNNLPILGVPLNLIVVPIASLIIVPLSLVSILMLPISEALATILLSIDSIIIETLARLIKAVSKPGWSNLKVSTISLVEIASFYLIIFTLFNIRKKRYLLYALPLLLIGLVYPTVSSYYQKITNDELRVTFLNVGQGEASFLEFPGGKTMLIDGGGTFQSGFDMGERVISPFLRKRRIRKIDYLVLSHAQRDHKGGLSYVARSFKIGEFWYNGKGKIPTLANALEIKNSPTIIMDSSTKPIDINGVQVRILNPPDKKNTESTQNLNESSLVLKFIYKEKSILFTGDIGFEAEALLKNSIDLDADILKAPHHGSRYSSSAVFLENVSPGVVVISSGFKNSYGFPHKEALDRFFDIDAQVFRTDLDGAIEAVIDGTEIEFKIYGQGKKILP